MAVDPARGGSRAARGRVWRLGASIRLRTALATLLVVAVTLVIAGVLLVWAIHRSLIDGLVTTATNEAQEVAVVASAGSPPAVLAPQAGVSIQIVDARGRVVGGTPDVASRQPVSTERPPAGTWAVLSTPTIFKGDDDRDLTVSTTVHSPNGSLTIYAITSTEQAENSTHLLMLLLGGVALPVLVVLAGVLGWVLVGRALRPVEAIRAEVADITAEDLHRRVPEPPLQDEIGRLARTMNEMLARLDSATERQRQFVSDASHELRSPLAALLAQVEVARAHPGSADWPAVAGAALEEGERLSRIVDDLLLLARSDEGHLAPGHDPVDLDEIALAEGRRLRAQGRVSVDLRKVGAGRVAGDLDQLRRVVRNLADNAERHAASTVRFGVEQHDGWVELVVADDGPGIPPHQRELVFERFARLDASRGRPAGGTGLGLAIVGDIVAAHHGTVEVGDSEVGAKFVVRLPALTAPT